MATMQSVVTNFSTGSNNSGAEHDLRRETNKTGDKIHNRWNKSYTSHMCTLLAVRVLLLVYINTLHRLTYVTALEQV